jgi:hypothetical protein
VESGQPYCDQILTRKARAMTPLLLLIAAILAGYYLVYVKRPANYPDGKKSGSSSYKIMCFIAATEYTRNVS